VTIVRDEPRD